MKLRYPLSILAVAVLTVSACNSPSVAPPVAAGASPAAGASAAPSGAPSSAPAANTPQAPHPAYKPVVDPKAAQTVKVKEYWDFEKDTPMEVENYEAKYGTDRDKDGNAELVLTAQVKLPTPKTMALLQADEDDEALDDAEDNVSDDEVGDDEPEMLDEDNDGDWDEDNDGYTDSYEDEEDDDKTEAYTEEEEQALLSGPHQVTMDVEDLSVMSDDDDTVWLVDETTGDELMISFDQDWSHYELENEAGTLKVTFNPDGTYTIDDQPAANAQAAIALLRQSEVVKTTSNHAIAFLSARLGRLPSESTRSTLPSTASAYHVTGAADTGALRAHALTEGLVKELVTFQGDQ